MAEYSFRICCGYEWVYCDGNCEACDKGKYTYSNRTEGKDADHPDYETTSQRYVVVCDFSALRRTGGQMTKIKTCQHCGRELTLWRREYSDGVERTYLVCGFCGYIDEATKRS